MSLIYTRGRRNEPFPVLHGVLAMQQANSARMLTYALGGRRQKKSARKQHRREQLTDTNRTNNRRQDALN